MKWKAVHAFRVVVFPRRAVRSSISGMKANYVYRLAPEHVPWQFDDEYEVVCQGLGLKPTDAGYVLYLLDSGNGELTFVCSWEEAMTAHQIAARGGAALGREFDPFGSDGRLLTLWPWWPYEFDGGARCIFCRAPDGSFLMEGPYRRFDVLVYPRDGDPPPWGEARPGRMNWRACADCLTAVENGALSGLLARFTDAGFEVSDKVRQLWADFCADHSPAWLDPAIPWTAARRGRIADRFGCNWEKAKAICADAQRDTPPPSEAEAAEPSDEGLGTPRHAYYQAVRALYDSIAAGDTDRIRSWSEPDGSHTVRADGRGWNLVGRTDDGAIMLLAKYPDVFYQLQHAGWVPPLLAELDRLGRNH